MSSIKTDLYGSIRDMTACRNGAHLLKTGSLAGTFIRGVCGIWVDGRNHEAVENVFRIKGEQRDRRPFGTTLDASAFVKYIDLDQIPSQLHDLFTARDELVRRLGSLCFIRVPIRNEMVEQMPIALISQSTDGTYWLQNWLPEGSPITSIWVDALKKEGIELPVATSMNVSGQAELIDAEQGLEFCKEHAIPLFLDDPDKKKVVHGSFPILKVSRDGIELIREGHFPAYLFRYLLKGWEIDISKAQSAKYPLYHIHSEEEAWKISAYQLRIEIIRKLD